MKQQGSVLLATLLVMMIMLFLGGVVTRLMATELEISQKFFEGIAAYYAAEAGVKRAFVEIDNRTSYNNFTEILKNSRYRVAITDGSNQQEKVVTAVGQTGQAVRKAVAYVSLAEKPHFACFSGSSMILNAKVIGRVGLRGSDITRNEGSSIEDGSGKEILPETGVSSFKLPLIRISFNENSYKNAQPLANDLAGGSYDLQGVYFVEGDFILPDTAVLAGSGATIFVKGNAVLVGRLADNTTIISTGTVTVNTSGGELQRTLSIYAKQGIVVSQQVAGQSLLMTKGDIHINGSLHGAVLAQGNVFVDSPVEGSVLAEKAVIQGSSGEVKYDGRIFDCLRLTRLQVIAWDF